MTSPGSVEGRRWLWWPAQLEGSGRWGGVGAGWKPQGSGGLEGQLTLRVQIGQRRSANKQPINNILWKSNLWNQYSRCFFVTQLYFQTQKVAVQDEHNFINRHPYFSCIIDPLSGLHFVVKVVFLKICGLRLKATNQFLKTVKKYFQFRN